MSEMSISPVPASEPETRHVKLLILGSGPAGLSAALYAARAELAPLVLSGTELGGQASLTFTIENYPGFPEGVGGAELGDLFQKQAERFGAKVEFDSAYSVDLSERPFKVITDNGEILADALIIATGASPIHLQIPGEKELTGKGVSYCGTCDGWFFKDKKVVVVGGGDTALEEGLFLTRLCQFGDSLPPARQPAGRRGAAKTRLRTSKNEVYLEHCSYRSGRPGKGRSE